MYNSDLTTQSFYRRVINWLMVMLCLVGIPTGLSFYAVYKYYSILEHENLTDYKRDRQHIIGIAAQATKQSEYIAQYLSNELRELSKQDLSYEDTLKWIKKIKKRLNNDFEFTTLNLSKKPYKLGEASSGIKFTEAEQTNSMLELLSNVPYFYNGIINRGYSGVGSNYSATKKLFGNQFVEGFLKDSVSKKYHAIICADSSNKKPPFLAYALKNCLMLFVFKKEAIESNSILKLILEDFKDKFPSITLGLRDAQNIDEGVWWSNTKTAPNIDATELEILESDNNEHWEGSNEYISNQFISARFRLITVGKKKYGTKTILAYSCLGAFIYMILMLPFVVYTKHTIISEQPGKASIRLKLIFLLWFATGIPLIAMSIISQEHYQNKRFAQLSNLKNLTKETIQNYDKKYRSFTKNMGYKLNNYFENWRKYIKENGFNKHTHQKTINDIMKMCFTDTVYVIASGSVLANYKGYMEYKGDLENPKIINEKSYLPDGMTQSNYEELRLVNIIAKKILFDLNHEELSSTVVAKLELIASSILQMSFEEVVNEIMTKVKDIQLWEFFGQYSQSYFDFVKVYGEEKYDYALICFWHSNYTQEIFLKETLIETNRNPSGIKLLVFDISKNSFFENDKSTQQIMYEYIEQKNDPNSDLYSEPEETLEYIKIKGTPYALINATLVKKSGMSLKDFEAQHTLPNLNEVTNTSKKRPIQLKLFEKEYKLLPLADNQLDKSTYFTQNLYPDLINDKERVIKDYIEGLDDTEAKELEILKIDGKDYAVFSANGNFLDLYKIIALYPLKNIEQGINLEKTDLMMYIIFSLILAISIAQLLFRSFIVPLNTLQEGAIAIEEKNYAHRIEDIGKDEFGEFSKIFNRIIVGLSEVETAKIVQESLFPKENFEQNNFKIYGKSVAMSGIGGDYYDYFVSDENSFSTLVGDVAGHGIAAALIMAMAKAGILCNKDQQNSPKTILQLLHNLILKSKSNNQRKIMTFQYIHCNSQTGEALYSNAGACSPFIYRKSTGEVEELKLIAPVLGGFKKATYNEIPVHFEPGDAIIFYTDGVVESRNNKGIEIGYIGLRKIIQKSYNLDPAIFFKNIYSTYLKHVDGLSAQDDVTIVIAIFQPQKKEKQEVNDGQKVI